MRTSPAVPLPKRVADGESVKPRLVIAGPAAWSEATRLAETGDGRLNFLSQ